MMSLRKPTPEELGLPISDEMKQLLVQAQHGDATVVPQLNELLDQHPAIWQRAGNIARHAEKLQIELAAGDDMLLRESLRRTMAQLKSELGRDDVDPLERLLVDRVVATWLQVTYADAMIVNGTDIDVDQANFLEKRKSLAQNSHASAIKHLATLRRMLATIRAADARLSKTKKTAKRKAKCKTKASKSTTKKQQQPSP